MTMNQDTNTVVENVSQRDINIATNEMLHFFRVEGRVKRAQEVLDFAHSEGVEHFNAFRTFYRSLPNTLRYDAWEHLNEFGLPHELIAP